MASWFASFEGGVHVPGVVGWSLRWEVPAVAVATYLVTVFSLKAAVGARGRGFAVPALLVAVHNLIIALWSLLMFLGSAWLIVAALLRGGEGARFLYCDDDVSGAAPRGAEYALLWIYYTSKFYELLDTVIIVLKKNPLIFLHWYHHAIIVPVTWAWLVYGLRYTLIGMAFNTLVHVFMYTYYGAAALRPWVAAGGEARANGFIGRAVEHVCTVWKARITSFQIFQFVCSFVLTIPFALYAFSSAGSTDPATTITTQKGVLGGTFDMHCNGYEPFLVSVVMNASFLVMFTRFKINAVRRAREARASSSRSDSKGTPSSASSTPTRPKRD